MSAKPREYAYAGKLEEAKRLETQAKALDRIIEKELDILGLKPNVKVLDAGCGTGAVTRRMAVRVFPETVYGVDVDSVFIEEAKKTASNEGLENIQFVLGNIDNLTHEKGTFDLAYCRLVLMHVHDTVKTISELQRVTKQGGTIAASDVDDGAMLWFPQTPKFFDLWSKFGQWAKARGDDRFIGRQLFSIFSKAGLDSVNIYPIPMYGTQQNSVALKMLVSVPVQIIEQDKLELIQEGIISAIAYEDAMNEVQLMLANPGAFAMGMTFLATGKVP